MIMPKETFSYYPSEIQFCKQITDHSIPSIWTLMNSFPLKYWICPRVLFSSEQETCDKASKHKINRIQSPRTTQIRYIRFASTHLRGCEAYCTPTLKKLSVANVWFNFCSTSYWKCWSRLYMFTDAGAARGVGRGGGRGQLRLPPPSPPLIVLLFVNTRGQSCWWNP